jgi:hypothetical protein
MLLETQVGKGDVCEHLVKGWQRCGWKEAPHGFALRGPFKTANGLARFATFLEKQAQIEQGAGIVASESLSHGEMTQGVAITVRFAV